MKVLFLISPQYLNALFEESKKYEFALQGYGNFNNAHKGLMYTNLSDVLGFAFVADALPSNLAKLKAFIKLVNVMSSVKKITFLFALRDNSGLEKIVNTKRYKNITFKYIPGIEVFTDVVINKGIFGSILLDNYAPYVLKVTEKHEFSEDIPCLSYKPLFTKYVMSVLDTPEFLSSLEETLEYDVYYSEVSKFNSTLGSLRECYLRFLFNEDVSEDLSAIENSLHSVDNPIDFCNYNAVLYCLKNKIKEKSGLGEVRLEKSIEAAT